MNEIWPKTRVLARWECGHELKSVIHKDTHGNGLHKCPYCSLQQLVDLYSESVGELGSDWAIPIGNARRILFDA